MEQKYYVAHNKAMGDWFYSSNGGQNINVMIAARAAYGESHGYWRTDEEWVFASEGFDMSISAGYKDDKIVSYNRTVNILKSSACHDLNGDTSDPNNPFFAFERVSLTPEISGHIGPHYVNTSKDITEVLRNVLEQYRGRRLRIRESNGYR